MIKKRKWDANVALLMIFWVTLVIAAWTIWLLWLYYKRWEVNEKYVYILWNTYSSLKEIKAIWLCQNSSYAKINYNPVNDTYVLSCEKQLWNKINHLPKIIKISACKSTDTKCKYKFRK